MSTTTWHPGSAQLFFTVQSPGFSSVQTAGSGNTVYIGGVAYKWKTSTAHIRKVLSSAWSCTFQLDYDPSLLASSVSNSPVPSPGAEVALFWAGVKRFGGIVQKVSEKAIPGTYRSGVAVGPSLVTVECSGYSSYLDRVIVSGLYGTVAPGDLVTTLWKTYLQQFGLTKSGSSGPAITLGDQTFHYITMTETMRRVLDQTPGWDSWVTDAKEFVYAETNPATVSPDAPFTLRDGDTNIDEIEVTRSALKFRNHQCVLPSTDLLAVVVDTQVCDGTDNSIFINTRFLLPENPPPEVRVNGTLMVLARAGDPPSFSNAVFPVNWVVYYNPNAALLPGPNPGVIFAIRPGLPGAVIAFGDVITVTYQAQYPLSFCAQDDASIAAVGLYESIYQGKNITDGATAQQMAQALLDLYGTDGDFPQDIRFVYNSHSQSAWLTPGMIMDVDITFPTALANYTVEEVSSDEQDGSIWRHTVTLRAGLGDVTANVDEQTFLTSARVGISSPPVRAEWMLAETLPGITNPGLATGLVDNFIPIQRPGVIDSWTMQSLIDPPTGADLQVDILLSTDGGATFATIFPSGATNKAVLPDGQTTAAGGFTFATINIPVTTGDILQPNVIQVGSTNPGTNIKLTLNIRSTENV